MEKEWNQKRMIINLVELLQELKGNFNNQTLMDIESSEPEKNKGIRIIDHVYHVDYQKFIGGGSYSKVYQAFDKANPKVKLACKQISKQELEAEIQKIQKSQVQKDIRRNYIIGRIKSEVEIGQQIKHPNIVKFIYFSETKNNIYIFMERCDENLQKYIKTHGAFSEAKALPIIQDIVRAACELYDRNITHRDIKAQNILLKDGHAVLADFGFAKIMEKKDIEEDGTGVGTLLYMAPQLIFEEKPQYSIRCDVWSIGVVIYYMLYGQVPWTSTQTIKSFQVCLKKPIDFSKGVGVSQKLKNLISKMLIFEDSLRISIKSVKMQIDELCESYEMDIQ